MAEQTRRDWVLSIAAGTGLAWASERPPALPPGVYLPSRDDLSHALMNVDAGYVKHGLLFFNASELATLRQLTALMLGEDSGSEVVQEVCQWIDLRLSDAAAVREAEVHVPPLYKKLMRASDNTNDEQLYREGLKPRPDEQYLNSISETEFFKLLKSDVIRGFYTSHTGLKELDYKGNAYYAKSPGCEKQR
jgi:hypothetical protein